MKNTTHRSRSLLSSLNSLHLSKSSVQFRRRRRSWRVRHLSPAQPGSVFWRSGRRGPSEGRSPKDVEIRRCNEVTSQCVWMEEGVCCIWLSLFNAEGVPTGHSARVKAQIFPEENPESAPAGLEPVSSQAGSIASLEGKTLFLKRFLNANKRRSELPRNFYQFCVQFWASLSVFQHKNISFCSSSSVGKNK